MTAMPSADVKPSSLTDTDLKAIEDAAVEMARVAGATLLRYFKGPLQVNYKSANNRNPVTDADHAVDSYLRNEIARRFPTHGIVTEETDPEDESATDIVWVIDPLDGTSNFLNGLPMFCVLIGVLEHGRPVVGAIFMPDIHDPNGRVIHSRLGGGAFDEDLRLSIVQDIEGQRRMSTWPGYFLRMFSFKKHLRRRMGDVRSIGSAGFELAQTGRGVVDYAVFNGLWAWDIAAGLAIILEAGGAAVQYDRASKRWHPFERFAAPGKSAPPTRGELNAWRGTFVVGRPAAVEFISSGVGIKANRWQRIVRRIGNLRGNGRR